MNIVFNMETADPDDVLTLCLLSHHPKVNLVGVTIAPGSFEQYSLVEDILLMLDKKDVLVGSKNPQHPKPCVSEFHYKWLSGRRCSMARVFPPKGEDVIAEVAKQGEFKIVSGAALSCIHRYLEKYDAQIGEAVIQGGFAGDSVVPEEYRLDKFKGRETCPTFNFNADVKAAEYVVATQQIKLKRFVSKNVCHGLIYDHAMHERIKPHRHNNPGLELMVDGMEHYLQKHSGKAFHDPLAACVAIDSKICKWAEVDLYKEKGEWGARKTERNGDVSDTFITIAIDKDIFEKVLTGQSI